MDAFRLIDKLFAAAAGETFAEVDVSRKVMRIIRTGDEVRPVLTVVPLSVFAGLSAVAASIVLFMAIQAWTAMSHPMAELFSPAQVSWIW